MFDGLLDFQDILGFEAGFRFDASDGGFRYLAELRPRFTGGNLNFEPRRELVRASITVNVRVGPDKRILNQVLGVVRVVRLMPQEPQQPCTVPLGQFGKTGPAALLRPPRQLLGTQGPQCSCSVPWIGVSLYWAVACPVLCFFASHISFKDAKTDSDADSK